MNPAPVCSPTWSKRLGPLWVQRLGPQGGAGLQLGFGELRQVGHNGVLVHIWIHNFLWSDDLSGGTGQNTVRTTWLRAADGEQQKQSNTDRLKSAMGQRTCRGLEAIRRP